MIKRWTILLLLILAATAPAPPAFGQTLDERRTPGTAVLAGADAGSSPALQAGTRAVELFAGLSFLPANGDDFPRTNSTGFQVGVAVPVNRWFAVFGEVAGHYSSSSDLGPNFPGVSAETSVYEFLVGPRFTGRVDKIRVFGHALIGTSKGHTNIGFSDSGFTFGGGGGVDVDVTSRLAVRGQFDLFGSFADIVDVNPRFAIGVVARLGG